MNIIAIRSVIVTSAVCVGIMSKTAHTYAIETYPPKHIWDRLSIEYKIAEYGRHAWILGSGALLGGMIWPVFVLSDYNKSSKNVVSK